MHHVVKGIVLRLKLSPAALSHRPDGATVLRAEARRAAREIKLPWSESNALVLRRGPYLVASGLDESLPNTPAPVLRGRFLDLFDADLPIVSTVELSAGRRALLL